MPAIHEDPPATDAQPDAKEIWADYEDDGLEGTRMLGALLFAGCVLALIAGFFVLAVLLSRPHHG